MLSRLQNENISIASLTVTRPRLVRTRAHYELMTGRACVIQIANHKGTNTVNIFYPVFLNIASLPRITKLLLLIITQSNATCVAYNNGNVFKFPTNKEPFLNQLAHVILVHNCYHSTSTCFHVYTHEYTCSAGCHEF